MIPFELIDHLKLVEKINKKHFGKSYKRKKKYVKNPTDKKDTYEKLLKSKGVEFLTDLEKLKEGWSFTLQDMGIKYGLSRERIRQIFNIVYDEPLGNYRTEPKPKQSKKESDRKRKEYYKKNKLKLKKRRKKYYEKNKKRMAEKSKKWKNRDATYNLAKAISWYDYTECSEDGFLITKCKYCGKKFTPKNKEVLSRKQALNNHGVDGRGLYCSPGCKKACPTFWQKTKYKNQKIEGSSREVQPELRQMCLERDNYTCQKCGTKGKTIQLHCHHIYPLNESPVTSADVDDCITLCKSCHKKAHKIPGCNTFELRCDST